jgi:hypothetical protein
MSEKSPFDRIIGGTDEQKDELNTFVSEMSDEMRKEMFNGFEVEQTESERTAIHEAVQYTNNIARKYGSKKEIELKNIFLLKEGGVEEYTKGKSSKGYQNSFYGIIAVDRTDSKALLSQIVVHECFHMASYQSAQIFKNDNVSPYRTGITMTGRDGSNKYFNGAEEGIVATLSERFFKEVILNNSFFKEKKEIQSADERTDEREKLDKVINEIVEDSKDKNLTKDQIFDEFAKAHFTGNYILLARIVEESLGKGSFRRIAEELGEDFI